MNPIAFDYTALFGVFTISVIFPIVLIALVIYLLIRTIRYYKTPK